MHINTFTNSNVRRNAVMLEITINRMAVACMYVPILFERFIIAYNFTVSKYNTIYKYHTF